jgi:hypothetical protein
MNKRLRWIGAPLLSLIVFNVDAAPPTIGGCQVFPSNNIWNVPVDNLPVHANSTTWVNTMGAALNVVPDFGSGLIDGRPFGIPFVTVPGTQPKVPITFDVPDESEPGPYPIPSDVPVEGGAAFPDGDRHIIVLDRGTCKLYEVGRAFQNPVNVWTGFSGAVFDLNSNALRPLTWTSADAAGLPILPGLVRYDEVNAGEITHALRFTVPQTKREFLWPGRHFASSLTGSQYPPMGARFRLKASFPEVKNPPYSPHVLTIIRALKKYGMMLSDNGSAWFISGATDDRWNNTQLRELRGIQGSWFEAVDVSSLQVSANSGEAGIGPFSVSGTISGPSAAIGNVSFCVLAGVTCNPSNASGQYSCSVPFGFSGRIYPRFANTIFSPPLRLSNVSVAQSNQNVVARQPTTCVLDADDNSVVNAVSDGLLALRWMLGLSGTNATAGVLGTSPQRTDAATIASHLTAQKLDIDGDSSVDAATDGLLLLRALLGFSGSAATNGAISACATRTSWLDIRSHLVSSCGLNLAQ